MNIEGDTIQSIAPRVDLFEFDLWGVHCVFRMCKLMFLKFGKFFFYYYFTYYFCSFLSCFLGLIDDILQASKVLFTFLCYSCFFSSDNNITWLHSHWYFLLHAMLGSMLLRHSSKFLISLILLFKSRISTWSFIFLNNFYLLINILQLVWQCSYILL